MTRKRRPHSRRGESPGGHLGSELSDLHPILYAAPKAGRDVVGRCGVPDRRRGEILAQRLVRRSSRRRTGNLPLRARREAPARLETDDLVILEDGGPSHQEQTIYNIAATALRSLPPLQGRMQQFTSRSGVEVFVDYAHTPESVAAALNALRVTNPGRRLVAVIGCSSNSDRGKRSLIARATFESADVCIFTSDNPDAEHPLSIARDMLGGIPAGGAARVKVVVDRREAITRAVQAAIPDGIVALLGKGSETIQKVNGRRLPHSDARIAREALRRLDESRSLQ